MTNPRQDNWKPIQQPASIPVHWAFNGVGYDKLIAGVEAQSMDSKWDISFDGETVHFYRSWTGYEIYNFALKQEDARCLVSSFNVEEDTSRYRRGNNEQEAEELSLILEHVVGVKPHE